MVGSGFSGTEIASTLTTSAQKVIHCFRRAYWVVPKQMKMPNSDQLLPIDLTFYNRKASKQSQKLSEEEKNLKTHNWCKQITGQAEIHKDLNIEVNSEPVFIAFSDHYLRQVSQEKIVIQRNEIIAIQENGLVFTDDSKEVVDAIIFCTGYQTGLTFLSEEILQCLGYQPQEQWLPFLSYQNTFHPYLPGLALVGMYRGPFWGAMALQADWACGVFAGKIALPSQEVMLQGIQEAKNLREITPRPQFPYRNYVQFSDSIAKEIGVLPPFKELKQQDFPLYKQLKEGPFLPVHFRLFGPDSDPELARKVMEEVEKLIK